MIGFLRRYVFHDFLLKVVSLVIAVLLWMALAREPNVEVAITAPIEFQHFPGNLEIVTEKIPEAQIRARGPSNVVRRMQQQDVQAVVDLSDAHPGEGTYDLSGSKVRVPPEVEVVQVVPAQLHLAFDRQDHREVPIRPRITGVYGSGPAPVVTVDPPRVLIVGPAKRVQAVEAVLTDPVDPPSGRSMVFKGIHIYVPDPLVRVAGPLSVTITVEAPSSGSKPAHSHSDGDRR